MVSLFVAFLISNSNLHLIYIFFIKKVKNITSSSSPSNFFKHYETFSGFICYSHLFLDLPVLLLPFGWYLNALFGILFFVLFMDKRTARLHDIPLGQVFVSIFFSVDWFLGLLWTGLLFFRYSICIHSRYPVIFVVFCSSCRKVSFLILYFFVQPLIDRRNFIYNWIILSLKNKRVWKTCFFM